MPLKDQNPIRCYRSGHSCTQAKACGVAIFIEGYCFSLVLATLEFGFLNFPSSSEAKRFLFNNAQPESL